MSSPLAGGPKSRVWLITGCSSGLGALFALEALKRGDKVIATSRQVESLGSLKEAGATILELDVTSSFDRIKALAVEAESIYGHVDVVVNNAGFPAVGPLEELGADGMRIQFEMNLFGVVNVTNALLPHMRGRREGTIVIIGSRSGWRTLPGTGAYSASKAAVHAYGDALAAEVEPFGIRVVTLIPGGFPTPGLNGRPMLSNPATSYPTFSRIDDYAPIRERLEEYIQTMTGLQPNEPQAFAELVVDVVRGEGIMRNAADGSLKPWPTRLVVGSDSRRDIRLKIDGIEKTMEEYPEFITYTDRDDVEQDNVLRN